MNIFGHDTWTWKGVNFMKKIWLGLGVVILLLFSGCSKKKTLETTVGTYKLDQYVYDYILETIETEDKQKEYGIEAYLIITGDTYGYYVYRDNQTNFDAKEVRLTYKHSSQNEQEITGIEYTLETRDTQYGVPGGYAELLKLNSKKLYSNRGSQNSTGKYRLKVNYTKISNATSLEELEETLNQPLPVIPYSLLKLDAAFIMSYQVKYEDLIPYRYYIIEINGYTMTATVYYALKADDVDNTLENIPVKYNEETWELQIGTASYMYMSGFPDYIYAFETYESENIYMQYYRNYGLDVLEYIQELKN